jgi:magnesium-transporting ATPase (P-type)
MMTFVLALSIGAMVINAFNIDFYWYLGIEADPDLVNRPWPYLPDLPTPEWETKTNNLLQNLFLFTTLLNNFVPLSLYITMEVVTRMLMTYINWDKVCMYVCVLY